MSLRSPVSCTGIWLLLAFLAAQSSAAEPTTRPVLRYRLSPGQHLIYQSTTTVTGASSVTSTQRYEIWVLRNNADGGWRVLQCATEEREMSTGPWMSMRSGIEALSFDLLPDGSIRNAIGSDYFAPQVVFPALPPDAGANQWVGRDLSGAQITKYSLDGAPDDAGVRQIRADADGDMNKVYLAKSSTILRFRVDRGYVIASSSVGEQAWNKKSEFIGETKLVSADTVDPATISMMATDDQIYGRAISVLNGIRGLAEIDATDAEQARRSLQAAQPEIQSTVYRQLLENRQRWVRSALDYGQGHPNPRAAVTGKPSPQWELNDLQGRRWRLDDLKGKVVVLDFWSRGCGPCIRAMPQIKQIVDDFRDKPVAVFGMNTDGDRTDAQFTAETMKLNYPTLLLGDDATLMRSYGVEGFPTLIIIGPDGIIRDIRVGWSTTLREDTQKKISQLLTWP